jgi:hypothetical protein
LLFSRIGFPLLDFSNPVYAYDMSFVASRAPLRANDEASVAAALCAKPVGRLVLALLDKAYESNDRWWAIQRLGARLNPPQPPRS